METCMNLKDLEEICVKTLEIVKENSPESWKFLDMKYHCCKNCTCASKKIKDPGCTCGNHEIEEAGKYVLGKRITIIMNDKLLKKLHEIQEKKIMNSNTNVSFSRVANEILRNGLNR